MDKLTRFRLFLWYFGRFYVPLIGHVRPKLLELTSTRCVIRLRLNRRTKNHLDSMYFGALAVGADIAGGLHGFYHAKTMGLHLSLLFKSFHAQFLKRAESDVYFICDMGDEVKNALIESRNGHQRINQPVLIQAFTHYPQSPEKIAQFTLEVSLKVT